MSELIYNQVQDEPVVILGGEDDAIGAGEGDRIFTGKMPGDALIVEVFGEFTAPNGEEPTYPRFLKLMEENSNTVLSQLRFEAAGANTFHARWLCSIFHGGQVGKLMRSGSMETPLDPGDGMEIVHAENSILEICTLDELKIGLRVGNGGSWASDVPAIMVKHLVMRQELAG